jgi:hypothetical protein
MTLILGFLASTIGAVGPLALAGGPLGIGIAWIGSLFANKTRKLIVIAAGLLLLIGTVAGLTVHIEHLEQDRAAYLALKTEVAGLTTEYGCDRRANPAQHDLAVCLTAIKAEKEKAIADELAKQRDEAAAEQAQRDAEDAQIAAQTQSLNSAVNQSAAANVPAPAPLKDFWARKRKSLGVK